MKMINQFAPWLGNEEYEAIRDVFDRNWITEGPKSTEFVERLCDLIGAKYGCLAPNGTLALYLALRAADIGPGDEVIVPDFTFFGSASAVEMTGAAPIFCDIDPETLQVKAEHFKKALSSRTKAVMPVHIYGMSCDMDPIIKLAKDHDLLIIEDAAQAIGVTYKGRHTGGIGDIGCFSFFADKTITTGEGGLIVTNSDVYFEKLKYLRNQGRIDRGSFIHPQVGYNFRMTDLQTAIGLVQLNKLPEIRERKLKIRDLYQMRLRDTPAVRFLKTTLGSNLIPFRVAIYVDNRLELMEFMQASNIETRTFFYPLHRQSSFQYLKVAPNYQGCMSDDSFPGAVYAYENGICLPSYPTLPEEHIDFICKTIIDFYSH